MAFMTISETLLFLLLPDVQVMRKAEREHGQGNVKAELPVQKDAQHVTTPSRTDEGVCMRGVTRRQGVSLPGQAPTTGRSPHSLPHKRADHDQTGFFPFRCHKGSSSVLKLPRSKHGL